MQNNITVATHAGFCFGVKRATDTVEQKLMEKQDGERIYTLGHLIHNEGYINWLAERGALSIEVGDIERVCESAREDSPVTVYIRAHGIPVEVENLLIDCKAKNQFFNYIKTRLNIGTRSFNSF
jgi:4-hydroxy-3-methylbut-2-enyl diphosphate reductase